MEGWGSGVLLLCVLAELWTWVPVPCRHPVLCPRVTCCTPVAGGGARLWAAGSHRTVCAPIPPWLLLHQLPPSWPRLRCYGVGATFCGHSCPHVAASSVYSSGFPPFLVCSPSPRVSFNSWAELCVCVSELFYFIFPVGFGGRGRQRVFCLVSLET